MTAEEVKRLVSILEKIVDTKIQEYALRENHLSPIAFEEKNMTHYTHGMYVDHILFRKFLHEVDLAKDSLKFLETLDERPDVTTADTESLYFVLEDGSLWYIEDGEYKIVNLATDAYTKTEIDTKLENYKTYSGFENRTDSTISINQTTGVFRLAPATKLFNVWTNSTGKHEIRTTQTKTIVADQTISYLYIDENGILQLSTTPWNLTDGNNAPCAIVFKDGSNYTLTDERHGFARNRAWHEWAHNNIGTMYRSGLVGTFTDTTLSITQGVIADEDITFDTLSTKTTASLWYRNGASGMRMVRNSDTPYSLNGATIQYDNGSGALQPVDNNKYTCSWVYCTNDSEEPIYVVIGQNQYNTQTLALNAYSPIINLSTAEWKLLYKVIYQNKNGITTCVQTVDYRTVQTGVATTQVAPTSHSNLAERDAANSHPATAISTVPPSGYTSTDVDGLTKEIITKINSAGSTDIISTNATNNTGTIVIDTTPNWQRVNITGSNNTLILDYENGTLPTKNREYLLVINISIYTPATILTLPTVSFDKNGITYNFTNTVGGFPINRGKSIEVNVVFFFIDATTCNIRTQITQFI